MSDETGIDVSGIQAEGTVMRAQSTVSERASAGAMLLDEQKPGWFMEIDTEKLSVANSCRCPLGQLYLSYGTGLHSLDINGIARAVALGFDCFDYSNRDSASLTACWRQEIEARRASAK